MITINIKTKQTNKQTNKQKFEKKIKKFHSCPIYSKTNRTYGGPLSPGKIKEIHELDSPLYITKIISLILYKLRVLHIKMKALFT